jgi:hypothetical protein
VKHPFPVPEKLLQGAGSFRKDRLLISVAGFLFQLNKMFLNIKLKNSAASFEAAGF